ncbi:DNA polymerase III epsilon subunit, exonuclease domain [Burkholderiales bacterium]
MPDAFAFVDIETSGSTPSRDGITEVAVITWDAGQVERWSTLVNPQRSIPEFIQGLTGITNEMVAHAPLFDEVVPELKRRLEGRVFVAHNARFDYAFIKQGFLAAGEDLRAPTLCTVKLSRKLFPKEAKHNLDAITSRHGLQAQGRHRAMADADLLLQFWETLRNDLPAEILEGAVQELLGRPSLPSHLDPSLLMELPTGPGVYLFYGENDLPIYIGKSKTIRSRVLAHFSSDVRSSKELSLAQQVRRVEWRETHGEVGALLLEAELVKAMKPTHNRQLRLNQNVCTLVLSLPQDFPQVRPLSLDEAWPDGVGRSYGLFQSMTEAKRSIRALCEEHGLCQAVLGIEKRKPGEACFGRQLRKCQGACEGGESLERHHLRLITALTKIKVRDWPFHGPAYLKEGDAILVFQDWAYLGTAQSEADLEDCLAGRRQVQFDRDTYRILLKVVGQMQPLRQ